MVSVIRTVDDLLGVDAYQKPTGNGTFPQIADEMRYRITAARDHQKAYALLDIYTNPDFGVLMSKVSTGVNSAITNLLSVLVNDRDILDRKILTSIVRALSIQESSERAHGVALELWKERTPIAILKVIDKYLGLRATATTQRS